MVPQGWYSLATRQLFDHYGFIFGSIMVPLGLCSGILLSPAALGRQTCLQLYAACGCSLLSPDGAGIVIPGGLYTREPPSSLYISGAKLFRIFFWHHSTTLTVIKCHFSSAHKFWVKRTQEASTSAAARCSAVLSRSRDVRVNSRSE